MWTYLEAKTPAVVADEHRGYLSWECPFAPTGSRRVGIGVCVSYTEALEPWLVSDLQCGESMLLPAGKSDTNAVWWWSFLASKVGSFLASAED